MSLFTELVEFIKSEQDGTCWNDVAYRAYDLDRATGDRALKRALRPLCRSWPEVRDDLARSGFQGDHKGALVRWSIWRMIRRGDITRFPLRKVAGNGARSVETGGSATLEPEGPQG